MTAIAKALSNVFPTTQPEFDVLKMLAVFCGVGLLASLVFVASGVSVIPTEPQALNVMNWI
jgi:uncharacterized BrkB/YihY/UPF0761 family membrane protein